MKKDFRVLLFYPNEPLLGIAPANLAILAACLKQDGFDVRLFDCSMYKEKEAITNDNMREKLGHVKKSNYADYVNVNYNNIHDDFVKIVEEWKPNLIAFTLIDSTIQFSFEFIKKIKHLNIPIITGGVATTFLYEKILNSNLVDFVCIGEGEEALVELCNKLMTGEKTNDIKNIYTKDKNGVIIKNPLRKLVNINELPIPDFSIYDHTRFYRPYMGGVVRMLPIDLDRGCPFICTYCAAPSLRDKFKEEGCGTYFRIKKLDKVFEEIKYLVKKHDINFLWFSSETLLAMSSKLFKEFAERYKKEVNMPFWCQSRLDTFTEEKTKMLAEMGCKSIAVGVEHGSEEIRQHLLHKKLSNERILESFKIISQYDIKPAINNMLGLPDETREDVFKTVELNREITSILKGNHTLNVFTFIPFSGTHLRDVCIEKGYIIGDEDIPISFFKESMLTMPSMSKKEIHGLEKTMALYILLPKSYWPQIKIAEEDNEEGQTMFNELIKKIKL